MMRLRVSLAVSFLVVAITGAAMIAGSDSNKQGVEVSVPSLNLKVIYPPGDTAYYEPHLYPNPERMGFAAIGMVGIKYQHIVAGRLAFHTPASSQIENYTVGVDEMRRFKPEHYWDFQRAFERKGAVRTNRYTYYTYADLGRRDYLLNCTYYEPGSSYTIQAITFFGETMIAIGLRGKQKCGKLNADAMNILTQMRYERL